MNKVGKNENDLPTKKRPGLGGITGEFYHIHKKEITQCCITFPRKQKKTLPDLFSEVNLNALKYKRHKILDQKY